jgi:radical S-adenosyl methionine domain-containing protein 2
MIKDFFETASFHIVKPCNMRCKFCYATFDDMRVIWQLPAQDAFDILFKLKEAGLQKITFAGGEPMLYKALKDVIIFSHRIGLTTSIITNGSLLSDGWLVDMKPYLDWIGVSIDSTDEDVNHQIGRIGGAAYDYSLLISRIKEYGYKLKINTVVNAYNKDSNMNDFISAANPSRWKVFQALRIKGQNDKNFDEIKVSDVEFATFIHRHAEQKSLVPESNEDMIGGYLLIDPQGRLFENTAKEHTYSDKLQNSTVEHCLSQINLKREVFERRGGVYNW